MAGHLRDGLRIRHGLQQLPGRVQLGVQAGRRPGAEEELDNFSVITGFQMVYNLRLSF